MPEVGQGCAIAHGSGGCAQAPLENLCRIRAGDRAHCVEGEGEALADHLPNGWKVEQLLHKVGISGNRIEHFDRHSAKLGRADGVDVDVVRIDDAIAVDRERVGMDRVRHFLRRGAAIAHIIFDAEILVRASGIMAGRQKQTTERA